MRLRDYLQQHQITQAAFGQRMTPPVSQGKVNHWINGTRRVSLAEALQIEIVTGGAVSPRDLVPECVSDDSPHPNGRPLLDLTRTKATEEMVAQHIPVHPALEKETA